MDIIITIALVYLAYRGYSWYTSMQQQVRGGDNIREVREEDIDTDAGRASGGDDDYIDYEEIK
jgi:hypothetical protein